MAFDKHLARYLKNKCISKDVLTLGKLHNTYHVDSPILFADNIGAKSLKSIGIDEGPTILHDLNRPVPSYYHNSFDVIIDGGTLEHVFNIPIALESVSRMLRVGGLFVTQQMCGISGHGFYQLSPELFWSWTSLNGYVGQHCVAYRHQLFPEWKQIECHSGIRNEIAEPIPHYFIFSAVKYTEHNTFVSPQQAPPSLVSRKRFWLWDTKLWSRKSAT